MKILKINFVAKNHVILLKKFYMKTFTLQDPPGSFNELSSGDFGKRIDFAQLGGLLQQGGGGLNLKQHKIICFS
jgi:hypothetical protein